VTHVVLNSLGLSVAFLTSGSRNATHQSNFKNALISKKQVLRDNATEPRLSPCCVQYIHRNLNLTQIIYRVPVSHGSRALAGEGGRSLARALTYARHDVESFPLQNIIPIRIYAITKAAAAARPATAYDAALTLAAPLNVAIGATLLIQLAKKLTRCSR
jgi:hypothetical protein